MSERFTFERVHRLEPEEDQDRNTVWFERFELSEEDCVQLLEGVLRPIDPTFTDEKLKTGKASEIFVGALEGFDLSPIECWDVSDRHDDVLYQLWLFDPSHGVLLEAGSTNVVGVVEWHRFRAFPEKVELSESVFVGGLRYGAERARAKHPKAELALVDFRT